MNDKDLKMEKLSLDAKITAIAVLIWSAPIFVAYLFVRFCLINPISSLFGGKK
jgi:hypothetical protein|tara:strand:- start:206 stop:364 length:159 start_codon:yes stop_codon:yes gene_type:complete